MAQYERNDESAGFPGMAFPINGAAAMHGVANSMMRGNMELVGLASRRARAQMDLPKQAMTCRTTADLGQLGAQFWRDAFHDYTHFNQRMMALWVQNMAAVGQGGIAQQASEMASRAAEPMAEAAERATERMSEDPAGPWAWWRADLTGLKPQGNGHSAEEARGSRPNY